MLSRRLLVSTLIQAGLFSLVCYIISLLISAAVSIPGGPTDGIDNARTNAKCPSCNNYHSGGSSRNVQSTFRYPSVVNHNTDNRMEHDRSLGVINTGPPKTLHNRTPFSVTNDSPSKSSTGGSTNGRQTLNPPRKRPLLHGSSRLLPEPKCSDRLCTEFLSEEDKSHFRSCLQKVEAHKGTVGEDHCRFMPQTHRAPVALASYPGSGNTWLRGLLETATGVCTGFEFCDISMRVKGFAGENIVSGAVLVVKTHGLPYWKGKKRHGRGRGNFDSAVFLVRNPLDALVSEWNRRIANDFHGYTISLTSHVKSAGKEWFGTNQKWVEFFQKQVPRWQFMIKEWVVSHERHAILVIKYEDLLKNASHQVKRILSFLQMPYRDKEVDERLAKGFDSFHRSHKPDFEHYTLGQKQRVLRTVNDSIQLLNSSRLSHLLDLHDYLHS